MILAGRDVGIPSHRAGGAAADSTGWGDLARCCGDATGTAVCVVYVSACHDAGANSAATVTGVATTTC